MNQLKETDTGIDIYRSRSKTRREPTDIAPLHYIASTDGRYDVRRLFHLMIRLHSQLEE